jgi:plasmid maintenance system antidote protein VapI
MLSTGEIIKVLLDEKGLHTKDLARITDLNEAAISNVLYNRTNKV